MNSNSTTFSDPVDDTDYSRGGGDGERTGGGYVYGLGACLSLILVLIIITSISYVCSRKRRSVVVRSALAESSSGESTSDDVELSISGGGLDEATLGNYPKLLYSEARLQKGGYGAAGCSICLADYKETDMLRHLPECGHLFHLMCVDSWLKLRPTCPICRS